MPTDADALAYITAVQSADAATLEDSVKIAIDNFVIGCKADGIWDAIKASCILAGARTLAGCLVPLVGTAPTNVGPFVTGDYSRTTGLKGNGSTKYLDSNRNNNADPQNDAHVSTYVTAIDEAVGFQEYISSFDGSDGSMIVRSGETPSNMFAAVNSPIGDAVDSGFSTGFFGAQRSVSTTQVFRADGVDNSQTVSSVAPSPTRTALVFARQVDPVTGFSLARQSFYSIGESLNLANLDTRVTRLLCEIEFGINTGLAGTGYDLDTLKYVNAGYAAGGTLA